MFQMVRMLDSSDARISAHIYGSASILMVLDVYVDCEGSIFGVYFSNRFGLKIASTRLGSLAFLA